MMALTNRYLSSAAVAALVLATALPVSARAQTSAPPSTPVDGAQATGARVPGTQGTATGAPAPSALPAAPAADAAPPVADATDAAQQGDIVVTGTSIRGVAPVGSALISVGRADIEASPSVTTAQLLQETPQVFNYGVSDSSRNGTGGAGNITGGTSINLRGLGPYATLTLLNGRRMVPNGTTAGFVDPSSIPTIALERVEIIADGASAIYGSDAVAGVANLILRRGVEGLSATSRVGFGDHYRDTQFDVIAGHKWSSGQLTVAYQHSYRSALNGRDRDFYRSDLTGRGGTNFTVTQCNPGNIVIGGVSYAIPPTGATRTNLVANTVNRCDNISYQDILPQQTYDSGSLTFDQAITDKLKFFVDAYATNRQLYRRGATPTQNLVVPSTNAFFVAPAGTAPTSETVQYSFSGDFGATRLSDAYSRAYQVYSGLEWDVTRKLRLSAYGSYGYNKDQSNGYTTFNTAAITAALASSNPVTAFNPFGTSANNATVLSSIGNYVVVSPGREIQKDGEIKLDGALFNLPGGELRFAVGGEYLDLSLVAGQSRGAPGALTGFSRTLGRNVKSGYVEVLIPVFGSDNAIPGFRKFDIDVAGRIESYSDVGTTSNPKVGVNWTPFDGLVLRGSYGTSFRAPTLAQLRSVSGSQLYIQNYSDPTANNGAGGTVQGVALSGDNTSLQPETASTWSLGAEYDPSFVQRLHLSLNYFNIHYDGQITGVLSNLNVLQQEAAYANVITRNPSQAFLQSLVAQGLTINGGTAANVLATRLFVDGRNNNLGSTKTDGLDIQLNYSLPTTNLGTFRFAVRGTRYFNFDVALTPTAPIVARLNTIDYPLKLRGRASLGWSRGGFGGTAYVNYSNGYLNNQTTPVQQVSDYVTVDASLSYRIPGDSWHGLKLGVEATNLFDRNPPFVNIAPTGNGGGGYDPQNANPIGRIVALTLGFDL